MIPQLAGKVCGVYKITSPSGKCYIGSSVDVEARWYGHVSGLRRGKHHCQPLQRAAHKYGVDSFVFELIDEIDAAVVRQAEQLAINCLMPEYNATTNTREPLSDLWKDPEFRAAGVARASAQIKRLREDPAFVKRQAEAARKTLKKRMNDPEYMANHVEAYSIPTINRVNADPAMKDKAAEGRRRRYAADPDAAARRSELGREIMCKLHADPVYSAELKVRASAAMKALRADPEARERNRIAVVEHHSKPVKRLDTGYVFRSVMDANAWIGANKSSGHIGMVIRGKRKRAGGYGWAAATKEEFEAFARSGVRIEPAKAASDGRKAVMCVETGVVYPSIRAAGEAVRPGSTSAAYIGNALRGKIPHAYGYHWEYVEVSHG